MKTKLHCLLLTLALLSLSAINSQLSTTQAQETRFFRISGPAATKITAFRPDGTIVWRNTLPGTNYTIQTVSSLPGGTNWVNYVQLPVTNRVNTNQIFAFTPPAGMALIPAGMFTIGDITGWRDATPFPQRDRYRRFTWT